MALSVRHCRASPSGTLTGRDCSCTRRVRMVSRRGLLDLMQIGHINFTSFMKVTDLAFSPGTDTLNFTAPFANGTQATEINSGLHFGT